VLEALVPKPGARTGGIRVSGSAAERETENLAKGFDEERHGVPRWLVENFVWLGL